MATSFRTKRDIVIPAGTVLGPPPAYSSRWTKNHEAPVALDRDHTGYLAMNVQDGIASGALEPVEG